METFSVAGNHKRIHAVSEIWVGTISICPITTGFLTMAFHVIRNRVCLLNIYMFRPELGHFHDLKRKKRIVGNIIQDSLSS